MATLSALVAVTLLAGCGGSGGSGDGDPKTLVVATHDSWAMSKDVLADFKKKTGITVKAQPQGDAGQLTNKLVLTKDSPLADGVYGIDNTFASRAVDEGILSSYQTKALPASAEQFRLAGAGADRLTPVDFGGAEELTEGWSSMRPAQRSLDEYAMPDEWLDRDLVIDLGTRRLDALSTPGHTQGHYVFADNDSSLLFAGDHVLSTITPSIGFEPAYVQQPLRDYLASLAKVRALPDMKLLPAHGPVTDSSHVRIDELVAHHDVRLDQSLMAVDSGASTAWEVAGELLWTRHERTREELGPFDGVLAAFETLAHLELLALQGKVGRTDGPTVRFHPLTGT